MVTRATSVEAVEKHWKITGLIALFLALLFFWPFLGVIGLAAIMAFLFHPLYKLLRRFLPAFFASWTTAVLSVAIVAIPVAIALLVAISQGITFATNLANSFNVEPSGAADSQSVEEVVAQVNSVIAPISQGSVSLSVDSVREFFSNTLPTLIRALTTAIMSFVSSLPAFLVSAAAYFFLFVAFLSKGPYILDRIRVVSPFKNEMTDKYFHQTGDMIKASMLGQLIIAFVLSVLTAILLLLIGAGPYFYFLVLIMTLLNMVPLGSGLIVYPLAILAILFGNVSGGVWVIIIYSFVICSLDNIMRPRLIPKRVQLATSIMTLSVLCGIHYFGFLGVVYGPVVAIILLTTFDAYVEYRKQLQGVSKKVKEA